MKIKNDISSTVEIPSPPLPIATTKKLFPRGKAWVMQEPHHPTAFFKKGFFLYFLFISKNHLHTEELHSLLRFQTHPPKDPPIIFEFFLFFLPVRLQQKCLVSKSNTENPHIELALPPRHQNLQ